MAQFNKQDLQDANAQFAMLRYYPPDPAAQAAIMGLLAKMVPSREALDWLVDAMVNRVGEWKGPTELRGVLCWRYRPCDGAEADSTSPGFTIADGERMYLENHERWLELERGADHTQLRQLMAAAKERAIA